MFGGSNLSEPRTEAGQSHHTFFSFGPRDYVSGTCSYKLMAELMIVTISKHLPT